MADGRQLSATEQNSKRPTVDVTIAAKSLITKLQRHERLHATKNSNQEHSGAGDREEQ